MQVPKICRLDSDTAMQEIRKKAPFYVPEWNKEDENDFGIVLSNIFSVMAEIISSRLNEAPKKHFLSFLEMINTSLIPASSARVPLTFVLSGGTPDNVLIESSTQVSADGPDGKPVIFETENDILATPAKLVSVYSVIEKEEMDRIFDNKRAVDGVAPAELLTGGAEENIQKHILYVGDENLLNLREGVINIDFGKIDIKLLNKLVSKTNSEKDGSVNWEYGVTVKEKKDGKEIEEIQWLFLGSAVAGDKVEITKETLAVEEKISECWEVISDKVKVNGVESRWIRCRVCENKINEIKDLKFKELNISVLPPTGSHDSGPSIVPNSLFYNDIPIQMLDNSFYPFGKKPYIYDAFYIGSKDAFSKKGYNVTLKFDLEPGKPGSTSEADSPLLSWEYWDGESWSLLKIRDLENKNRDLINLSESTKCKKSKGSQKNSHPNSVKLTIPEMPEVKLAKVNGKENYWIRARLVGGNYGKEYEIVYPKQNVKVMRGEVIPSTFCPPQITNLMINFEDKTKDGSFQGKQPEYVFSENSLVLRNYSDKLKDNKGDFRPFVPFSDSDMLTAIYFGFDKELKKGPISLFIDIDEEIEYPELYTKVKWQYLTAKDPEVWKELEVLDETAGFTKEGMVQFNVSESMQADRLFGLGDQYWIRVMGKFPTYKKKDESSKQKSCREYEKYIGSLKNPRPELSNSLTKKGKDEEKQLARSQAKLMKLMEKTGNTESNGQTKNSTPDVSATPECNEEFEVHNINFYPPKCREIPPKVLGFYLNSVWASQYRTIYDETIGSGRGETDQKFKLVNIPVTKETICVNEINNLSEKEREQLLQNTSEVTPRKDSKGNIVEFWVRWTQVNDFLDSKSRDRHYTIDRTTGEVFFGDGKNGMNPPIGFDNVKATYRVGGGEFGNLDHRKISKLQSSIAFVDKVFNPSISDGGAKTEDIDSLLIRAPNALKNRNRAIASEDYEWLAKEASTKVAKVKALPNFNPEKELSPDDENTPEKEMSFRSFCKTTNIKKLLEKKSNIVKIKSYKPCKNSTCIHSKFTILPKNSVKNKFYLEKESKKFSTGYVAVVIVPESPDPKPFPSNELKRMVELHLKERCPAVVILRVISPSYVRTEISATLLTNAIYKIPDIETEAKRKISEFLHPLRGSTEKRGWNFGSALYISDIYSILGQIEDVDHVNKVTIDLYDDLENSRVMKLSDACSMVKLPDYALPYSGEHKIIVDWKNSEKEG